MTEIVLVDDHQIFRQGLRTMLEQQDDLRVVGEAGDGREGVELVRELTPEVVILDVGMRSMNGVEACRWIVRERPGVKVIALSMHDNPRLVREMLRAGASGYLLKECAFSELAQAIRAVADHDQVYLGPAICRSVVDGYLNPPESDGAPGADELTPREREIVQLVSEGRTSREIAEVLGVSAKTIEKHRLNIARKLGTSSLADLVKYALREGITTV